MNFYRNILLLVALASAVIRGCEECPAAPSATEDRSGLGVRMRALGQVESGDNDLAVGAAGERGRYQLTERVWREVMPAKYSEKFTMLTNSDFAFEVAYVVMRHREDVFINSHRHCPNDFEWYLLWACPGRVDGPGKVKAETARRFANLCRRFTEENEGEPRERLLHGLR